MPKCKVSRRNLVKVLSGVKDDNINIMGIGMKRKNFVDALKIIDADVLEMSTGLLSWHGTNRERDDKGNYITHQEGIENEPCLNVVVDHHVMRFLNRPITFKPMCKVDLIDYSTIEAGIVAGKPEIEIDSLAFYEAIKRIAVYASKEEARPVLECVFMQFKPTRLVLTAADGFRLGLTEIPLKDKIEFKPESKHDHLINALELVKGVLPMANLSTGTGKHKDYGYIGITLKENAITFEKNGQSITISHIMGNFPQYDQLIPKEGIESKFMAWEMLEAVKNLGKIAADGSGITRLEGENEAITLSATSEEIGDTKTNISAKVEQPFKIAFNYSYLASMLSQMPKDTIVKMLTSNPSSPGKFTWDNYTVVIMPMFVQWPEKSKDVVPAMA